MQVLVIGCGPAGIGAGNVLHDAGAAFEIIDAGSQPGGLAVSDQMAGFLFDRTGHFLHTRSDRFRSIVARTGIRLETVRRKSSVVIEGRVVPSPIQYNLWALSAETREAVVREIDAAAQGTAVHDSLATSLASVWGPTLLARFFRPYNEKLLGQPLELVPSDCLGRFLPKLDRQLLRESCHRRLDGIGYNATFQYPELGSIGALFEAIAEPLALWLRPRETVTRIDTVRRRCYTRSGHFDFDRIVSTAALPTLLRMCGIATPDARLFDHSNVLNIRTGFRGRMLRDDHWVYVPDRELPFYRIGFPLNVNTRTCPERHASLSIECGPGDEALGPPAIGRVVEAAISFVESLGFAKVESVSVVDARTIAPAYVLHRSRGRPEFEAIFERLEREGVYSCGRYGRWEYLSMEDSYLDGERAARTAIGLAA